MPLLAFEPTWARLAEHAHLVAVDARTGELVWDKEVAKPEAGYAMTHAPLIIKDKVIVGTAGGEFGIRGFIAAFEAATGNEAWRFYTIPGKGEPGNETWAADSWQHGGASVWVTGSYDPESNLTYWGIGNPGPDWNVDKRGGVISFNCGAIHPHDIGTLLDQEGIAIRAGHHCCQPFMRDQGISGTARASFYIYNTRDEVDLLVKALRRAATVFEGVSA